MPTPGAAPLSFETTIDTTSHATTNCRQVIDGANVCWTFGRHLRETRGEGGAVEGPAARPNVEGLRTALSCPIWQSLELEPIVFLPSTCEAYDSWEVHECSVTNELLFESHKLVIVENGVTVAACGPRGNVGGKRRPGAAAPGGTKLRHKAQRARAGGGRLRGGMRPKPGKVLPNSPVRSRDDILLLRFAQKNNAWVLSNDRFRDHSVLQRRGWNGWLKERRVGFRFFSEGDDSVGFEILPGSTSFPASSLCLKVQQ